MNKFIIVSYTLEGLNDDGTVFHRETEATVEAPMKFVSGMGYALDAFEERIVELNEGDTFDFTLEPEEAYGPYDENHVVNIPREHFTGLDATQLRPGANIPLVNEDGMQFVGHVLEVGDESVRLDLNDILAGKRVRFTGQIIVSRPATNKEIEGMANLLAHEGCGCGCEHDHKDCHCHDGNCCHHHDH